MIIPKLYEGFNAKYECQIHPGNYTGEFEFDFSNIHAIFDGQWKLVANIFINPVVL